MGTRQWAVVVLLCTACGGSEDPLDAAGIDANVGDDASGLDAGDAGRIEDVHAFCAAYRERLCTWSENCRSDSACTFPVAMDLDRACATIDEDLAAGIVAYDPAAAAACLTLDFTLCGVERAFDADVCRTALHGNVPIGGDCYPNEGGWVFNRECVPGAFCALDGCPGTCAALGGVGADCTTVSCAEHLRCDGGVCAVRPTEGETCAPGSVCASPAFCLEGTCFVAIPVGAACPDDGVFGRCSSPSTCVDGVCSRTSGPDQFCRSSQACPEDYGCHSASGRCRPLLDVGEPCDDASSLCRDPASYCADIGVDGAPDYRCAAYRAIGEDDCAIYRCASGAWCRGGGPGDAAGGTCRPPGGEGDLCNSTISRGGQVCESGLRCAADGLCHAPRASGGMCAASQECMGGLWCQTGACAPPAALGASCQSGDAASCVAGAYCEEQVCVAQRPDGAPCTGDSNECVSHRCDGETCVAPPCRRAR